MAVNTNKRIAVKWIRDKAKAAYQKQDHCYICGTSSDLELHHTHSITLLLNKWASDQNYDVSTDDGILAVRDEFIAAHKHEIYEAVYTLCNKHHVALHRVYGKSPVLSSAAKQGTWIETQKHKIETGDTTVYKQDTIRTIGIFSKFTESCNRDFAIFYRK